MNCNNGKTSKDIIIRLIDAHKIDGEEAYILIRDIVQKERTVYTPTYLNYPETNGNYVTTTTDAPCDYSYSVSSNTADYVKATNK